MRQILSIICYIGALVSFILMVIEIVKNHEYRQRAKQLKQLVKIYRYFQKRETQPDEATNILTKDIKIENNWLYSEYFYFDLNEHNFIERIENYLLEILEFFINGKHLVDKDIINDMLEFKDLINSMA